MARTIAQIRGQIEALQKQEKALLAREVSSVVDRIREAIGYYGLTVDQLFQGASATRGRPSARKGSAASTKGVDGGRQAKKGGRPPSPSKGRKVAIKYRDKAGNAWSGRGSQPRWLREALSAGKSIEDFLV